MPRVRKDSIDAAQGGREIKRKGKLPGNLGYL